MKNKSFKTILLAFSIYILLSLVGLSTFAQNLTIKGKVLFNGKETLEQFKVSIINLDTTKDYNSETNKYITNFSNKLEYNKDYMIIISKEGYQTKAIAISTHCNSKKSFKYFFNVDLNSQEEITPNPLFVGGIFYDKKKKIFDYYLKTYTLK